ncbi:hypothetical protein F5887DRAFT_1029359 [Amanita rubescens]|nr:hypothetical protein F5887DRAFT_1029359 [Amanita rubescens]
MRRDVHIEQGVPPNEFGSDHIPSSWVVQSSGVDYLHMLIVLSSSSGTISERDASSRCGTNCGTSSKRKTSTALGWHFKFVGESNGCIYAQLGMDDLQGASPFSSAVDVDKWLGKEVNMECVTPSQPVPIPPRECQH